MKKGEVRKGEVGYTVHLNAEENVRKFSKPKKRHPRFEGESACEYQRGGDSARGRARVALLVALLSALTLVSFRCAEEKQRSYSIKDKDEKDPSDLLLILEDSKVVGTPHHRDGYIEVVFKVRNSPIRPQTAFFSTVGHPAIPPLGLPFLLKSYPASAGEIWREYKVQFKLPDSPNYPVKVTMNVPWGLGGKEAVKAGFTVIEN